ncbi:uncharacterized protein LOC119322975 [Triticum dicoccoides]|uniref:uncharacterized protein LOC119322975 n=1 Tax=Triticum dicoccoides TaxID=85692 RepID=UPI0018913CDC|nr:uncharacterized protein LOC119322975 [Triticum dicoccoides]
MRCVALLQLDLGGAGSCWLELGCNRVDGSMPHKHREKVPHGKSVPRFSSAMLSTTPWLQGGRVRRDHQFRDLHHCACRYHGPLVSLRASSTSLLHMEKQQESEMLCSSEVADYVSL